MKGDTSLRTPPVLLVSLVGDSICQCVLWLEIQVWYGIGIFSASPFSVGISYPVLFYALRCVIAPTVVSS